MHFFSSSKTAGSSPALETTPPPVQRATSKKRFAPQPNMIKKSKPKIHGMEELERHAAAEASSPMVPSLSTTSSTSTTTDYLSRSASLAPMVESANPAKINGTSVREAQLFAQAPTMDRSASAFATMDRLSNALPMSRGPSTYDMSRAPSTYTMESQDYVPSEYTSSFMERSDSAISENGANSRRFSAPQIMARVVTHSAPKDTRDRSSSITGAYPLPNNVVICGDDSKTFAPRHRAQPSTELKSCLSPNPGRGRMDQHEEADQTVTVAHACAMALEERVLAEQQAEMAHKMLFHIRQGVAAGSWTKAELWQSEAVWRAAQSKLDDAVAKETMYEAMRKGVRASSKSRRRAQ